MKLYKDLSSKVFSKYPLQADLLFALADNLIFLQPSSPPLLKKM